MNYDPSAVPPRADLRRIAARERAVGLLFKYLSPIATTHEAGEAIHQELGEAVDQIIEAAALRALELREDGQLALSIPTRPTHG